MLDYVRPTARQSVYHDGNSHSFVTEAGWIWIARNQILNRHEIALLRALNDKITIIWFEYHAKYEEIIGDENMQY